MVIGTYILITTLNVNGLNAPTKRHRLAEGIWKQDPYICCLQETHFRPRNTYRLKVREWKKIFHVNGNQKKAGVPILILDKIGHKRQRRTLNNDQRIKPRRKYINGSVSVVGAHRMCWRSLGALFWFDQQENYQFWGSGFRMTRGGD